jgi:hypothetical protein
VTTPVNFPAPATTRDHGFTGPGGEPDKDHRTGVRVSEVSRSSIVDIDKHRWTSGSTVAFRSREPITTSRVPPAQRYVPKEQDHGGAPTSTTLNVRQEEPINDRCVNRTRVRAKCVSRRSESSYDTQ